MINIFSRHSPRATIAEHAPVMCTVPDEFGIRMSQLARNPTALRNFAIFSINDGTYNEVLCYYTIESFRKFPTEPKAIYICNTFIVEKRRNANDFSSDVNLEVNLKNDIRIEVLAQMNRPRVPRQRIVGSMPVPPELFSKAQRYVEGTNIADCMTRYQPLKKEGTAWFYAQQTVPSNGYANDFRKAVREIGQMGFHLPTAVSQI